MPHVSLIVEALRARPHAVFWFAIAMQAAIWVVVPGVFYASPPGDLPRTLAIGHEWQLGSWLGPPLAFWLAEAAFRAAGAIGVYVLSQACVVVACWAMFALGRSIVGAQKAALAALLMQGVLALSLPTPEFGPMVLAAPLTALALLHFWRALGEGRRNAWLAVAIELGLLLLTTYWGVLLFGLLAVFLLATAAGRRALATIDPWAALLVALMVAFPHAVWLWQSGAWRSLVPPRPSLDTLVGHLAYWPLLLVGVVALHAGLIMLAILAGGWRADRTLPSPEIKSPPLHPLARRYIYFIALALPLCATLLASLLDAGGSAVWAAPFVLMTGLAVVAAAGPRVTLRRQHVVGVAWGTVLLVPPLLLIAAILGAPWTGVWEWETDQPSAAMGRFYSDTFRRRTGRPLAVVVGDSRAAYLVALGAPERPRWLSATAPAQTPWLTDADVRTHGAIVVWNASDPGAPPPADIRVRFPEMVAEIPQSFERPMQGFLPALRIGWGLVRPRAGAAQ